MIEPINLICFKYWDQGLDAQSLYSTSHNICNKSNFCEASRREHRWIGAYLSLDGWIGEVRIFDTFCAELRVSSGAQKASLRNNRKASNQEERLKSAVAGISFINPKCTISGLPRHRILTKIIIACLVKLPAQSKDILALRTGKRLPFWSQCAKQLLRKYSRARSKLPSSIRSYS